MSFILDALKKSENERQRRETPALADVPVAAGESRAPRWVWALAALLAVNLLALAYVLTREPTAAIADEAQVAAQIEPAIAAEPQRAPVLPPKEEVRPLLAEVVAEAREQRETSGRAAAATEPAAGEASSGADPGTVGGAPLSPASPRASMRASTETPSAATMTTYDELRAQGQGRALPELRIDIHVYDAEAVQRRFVSINARKYREGDRLNEGPVVREIVPEGVVLEDAGTAFLLSRD